MTAVQHTMQERRDRALAVAFHPHRMSSAAGAARNTLLLYRGMRDHDDESTAGLRFAHGIAHTLDHYPVELDDDSLIVGTYSSLDLTPEELQVRNEALSSIPAPCCDDFSAATCCSRWSFSSIA